MGRFYSQNLPERFRDLFGTRLRRVLTSLRHLGRADSSLARLDPGRSPRRLPLSLGDAHAGMGPEAQDRGRPGVALSAVTQPQPAKETLCPSAPRSSVPNLLASRTPARVACRS